MPLANGHLGLIGARSHDMGLFMCAPYERPLLERRPDLLIDVTADELLGRALLHVAKSTQTNLRSFDASFLASLLPALLPPSWHGLEVASLATGD